MATKEHPNRNVNMPMDLAAVEAARSRLSPGHSAAVMATPHDGKGSRREVRAGEWVDDRVIIQGGPASPSADTPPEIVPKAGPRSLPTFDPAKVYAVTLAKACVFAGRALAPAKTFQMTGETCLDPAVNAAIGDAVEIGDVPSEPNIAPSMAKAAETEANGNGSKKRKG